MVAAWPSGAVGDLGARPVAARRYTAGQSHGMSAKVQGGSAHRRPRMSSTRRPTLAGSNGVESLAAAVDDTDRLDQVERRGVLVEQAVGAGDACRDAQTLSAYAE
jgi:hypothetical protein